MSRASRQKGKRGELQAVKLWESEGFDARRTGDAGQVAGDLEIAPGKLYVEVRFRDRLRMTEWMREIEDEAPDGYLPLLFYRQTGHPWAVSIEGLRVMRLFGFLRERGLLEEAIDRMNADV